MEYGNRNLQNPLFILSMPELFTINEDWIEQRWFSTGGTRAKKYLFAPDGKFYYFKRSQIKPGKDYTFEFWNEIIAYELGTMLGLKMLRYDIAVYGDVMGCISASMIDSEKEELVEGIKYLQAISPDFDPAKKECKKWYTFDLIERALKAAKIGHFIDDVIQIIIFDSLIGNGDRHQENWAIITQQRLLSEILEGEESNIKAKWLVGFYKKLKKVFKESEEQYKKSNKKIPKHYYETQRFFAPIYDSGSCLGRELLDEKVESLLRNDNELNSYVNRGTSEIHWSNSKIKHYELIENLLHSGYGKKVSSFIENALAAFNLSRFTAIIESIDDKVPSGFEKYKISNPRKQLIIKMVALRIQKLREIWHEGI